MIRKIPARDKPLKHGSANLHLNFTFEKIDNRMRIIPMDHGGGSWVRN
ncbi:hypothetical protein JAO29_14890 [Edaphobacter sp. HDX4]